MMKKSDIRPALEALKDIPFNKVTDEDIARKLVDDALVLAKADRAVTDEVKDARDLLLGKYGEQAGEVERIQTRLLASSDAKDRDDLAKKLDGYKDYFAAQRAFLKKQDEILSGEVDGLTRIDRDKFLAAIKDIDFTFGQLIAMQPLFDLPYIDVKPNKK